MPIDPSLLSPAGRVFYDESLTTEEARERLRELLEQRPELEGEIAGYLSNLDLIDWADDAHPG